MALLSRLLGGASPEPVWIEVDALHRRLEAGETLLLVDVRQPEEFATPPGHLPGALNIPLAEVLGRTQELIAHDVPIVVVCQTDRRSARAAAGLVAGGAPDVMVLRGGTVEWHRQGLELQ